MDTPRLTYTAPSAVVSSSDIVIPLSFWVCPECRTLHQFLPSWCGRKKARVSFLIQRAFGVIACPARVISAAGSDIQLFTL